MGKAGSSNIPCYHKMTSPFQWTVSKYWWEEPTFVPSASDLPWPAQCTDTIYTPLSFKSTFPYPLFIHLPTSLGCAFGTRTVTAQYVLFLAVAFSVPEVEAQRCNSLFSLKSGSQTWYNQYLQENGLLLESMDIWTQDPLYFGVPRGLISVTEEKRSL